MVLAFEKGSSVNNLQKEENIDNIFIAAFNNQSIAENYIAEHIPSVVGKVIYKECIVLA